MSPRPLMFWLLAGVVQAEDKDSIFPFDGTSLEHVFTRAISVRINDGTWETIFGKIPDIIRQPFCQGAVKDWPVPTVVEGSDLDRVLKEGIFRCGHLANGTYIIAGNRTTNIDIFASGTTLESAKGVIVDWWNSLAEAVAEEMGSEIKVTWNLYPSSQATFDALAAGEIDSACGYWAPDGTYTLPAQPDTGNTGTVVDANQVVSRAVAFSMQTCPSFLQSKYVYTPVDSPVTDFDGLIAAINGGSITDVCVSGSRGGGFETSCQNILNLFATGNVNCTGYGGAGSFPMLGSGNCQAVWEGVPAPETLPDYNLIPFPFLYAPVSFFRMADLSRTISLELAATQAFNQLIHDGVWNEIFYGYEDTEPSSYCTVDAQYWPTPPGILGSDLQNVLDRGTFRCGYQTNAVYYTSTGVNLIDTSDPENIMGLVPEFFSRLIAALAKTYDTDLNLEWILQGSPTESFTALNDGAIDAACGYWVPNGQWTNPETGKILARPLVFSMMHCPTVIRTDQVFTPLDSGIDSYIALTEAIEATNDTFRICATDEETGALVTSCNDLLRADAPLGQPLCVGAPKGTADVDQWSDENLASGMCSAKWSGVPPESILYNYFDQPSRIAFTSFFRTRDFAFVSNSTNESNTTKESSNGYIESSNGTNDSSNSTKESSNGTNDVSPSDMSLTAANSMAVTLALLVISLLFDNGNSF